MRRRLEWALLGVAVVAGGILWWQRGGDFHEGQRIEAPITLVAKDRSGLSCALERAVGPYRCEFAAPGSPTAPAPAPSERLVPYMTSDQILYLVPGLFEVPSVNARHADRARSSRRFTAECELELVERVDAVGTRWGRDGEWGASRDTWVARPLACAIVESD